MKIDIWSDYLCPFCYLGKERLEVALKELNIEVDIKFHAFELNPEPSLRAMQAEMMQIKYGMGVEESIIKAKKLAEMCANENLVYKPEKMVYCNTRKAHQLTEYAYQNGVGNKMVDYLMSAHFAESIDIDDTESLLLIAEKCGLNRKETESILSENKYMKNINNDLEFAKNNGINSVPFFVINDKYGVNGAQSPEYFIKTLTDIQRREK